MFNSFTIDFLIRHRILTNLTLPFMYEIPVPRFDKNNILHKKVLRVDQSLLKPYLTYPS